MHQMRYLKLASVIALLEAGVLAHLWLSQGPVLLSQPNGSRQFIGQVVTRRDFPYLSVQAYLEVRASGNGALRQRHFLLAGDQFQDLADEIRSLEWREDSIALDIQSAQYSGPPTFVISE